MTKSHHPALASLSQLKPSMSLHEGVLSPFYRLDKATQTHEPDGTLAVMSDALRRARQSAEGVASLASVLANDPTLTPAAAALTLRDKSEKALTPALEAHDRARASVLSEIAAINKDLDALPSVGSTEAGIEAEIRSSLSRMDSRGRAKAIAESDDRVAAAILRAPAMLSGMGNQEQAALRHQWRAARNPDAFERLSRLEKALDAFDRSGALLVKFVGAAANVEGVRGAMNAQAATAKAIERIG